MSGIGVSKNKSAIAPANDIARFRGCDASRSDGAEASEHVDANREETKATLQAASANNLKANSQRNHIGLPADNSSRLPASRLVEVWQAIRPELLRLAAALGAGSSLPNISPADVLQDVYIKATQLNTQQRTNDEIRRWLFRVTINCCKQEGRKHSRWRRVWQKLTNGRADNGQFLAEAGQSTSTDQPQSRTQSNTDPSEDVTATVIHKEQRELIRQALDMMPNELREVLVLRYFHDQNSREIAAVLQTSDSTIRTRLKTARRRLAAALNTRGIHEA